MNVADGSQAPGDPSILVPYDLRNVWCRWRFHNFVPIEPTDDEFEEMCRLLGLRKFRVSSFLSAYPEAVDQVCVRCGTVEMGLKRLLKNLRNIRGIGPGG